MSEKGVNPLFPRPGAQPVRSERCACGGIIGVVDSPGAQMRDVLEAVQSHQQTEKHRTWDYETWADIAYGRSTW